MLGRPTRLPAGQDSPGGEPRPRFARKAERIAVNAQVSLRRAGQLNYRVRAFDATRFGCKIEFIERPFLDERVWVKFDGLTAVEGLVCWIEDFVAGIEFVQAIHPAVFESMMPRLR